MRNLPDNANLDHVRRQAKDQLRVLRPSRPEMTLSDAQAMVAQQYGYRNWAELKRAVTARAAATPETAPADLAASIASAFGLGTPSEPMTHAERDWAGQIWDLRTDAGQWVVTELADHCPTDAVEEQSRFVVRAVEAGIAAPEPVPTDDGTFVLSTDSQRWRVHRHMVMGPPLPQPPEAWACAEGGRILARLHRMAEPARHPVVPWLTHRHPEASWTGLADKADAAEADWAGAFRAAIPGFLALGAVADDRDPDERAIMSKAWHAPAGARPVGEGRLVALGWDHSGSTPPDWELGSSLMAWSETASNDHDVDAARTFLSGYRELAGSVDITLPMFASGVSAALNWTISRANIALNHSDPVYREEATRNIRVLSHNPLTLAAIERLAHCLESA